MWDPKVFILVLIICLVEDLQCTFEDEKTAINNVLATYEEANAPSNSSCFNIFQFFGLDRASPFKNLFSKRNFSEDKKINTPKIQRSHNYEQLQNSFNESSDSDCNLNHFQIHKPLETELGTNTEQYRNRLKRDDSWDDDDKPSTKGIILSYKHDMKTIEFNLGNKNKNAVMRKMQKYSKDCKSKNDNENLYNKLKISNKKELKKAESLLGHHIFPMLIKCIDSSTAATLPVQLEEVFPDLDINKKNADTLFTFSNKENKCKKNYLKPPNIHSLFDSHKSPAKITVQGPVNSNEKAKATTFQGPANKQTLLGIQNQLGRNEDDCDDEIDDGITPDLTTETWYKCYTKPTKKMTTKRKTSSKPNTTEEDILMVKMNQMEMLMVKDKPDVSSPEKAPGTKKSLPATTDSFKTIDIEIKYNSDMIDLDIKNTTPSGEERMAGPMGGDSDSSKNYKLEILIQTASGKTATISPGKQAKEDVFDDRYELHTPLPFEIVQVPRGTKSQCFPEDEIETFNLE